jgi:hypothetical protein
VAVLGAGADAAAGGLAEALRRIARGEASTLLLARLEDGARDLAGLLALIDWLWEAGADLLAVDVGFDTGSPPGRQALEVLRRLQGWDTEPGPRRPPRGRPGLRARIPELGERLLSMRESGMTMQAIADTLNAEGVPTQRGGALWRPSSVQSALGYRRPRPPLPGPGHLPKHPGPPEHPAGPDRPRPGAAAHRPGHQRPGRGAGR